VKRRAVQPITGPVYGDVRARVVYLDVPELFRRYPMRGDESERRAFVCGALAELRRIGIPGRLVAKMRGIPEEWRRRE
jgi:hypothetical protein